MLEGGRGVGGWRYEHLPLKRRVTTWQLTMKFAIIQNTAYTSHTLYPEKFGE